MAVGATKVGRVTKYTLDWTSDGAGAATVNSPPIYGEIVRVVFKPGSGGSQPTDLYDVTLTDEHGMDLLAGQGANLSNASTTNTCPGVPLKDGTTTSVRPMTACGSATLNVTNAGATKSGSVYLYVISQS